MLTIRRSLSSKDSSPNTNRWQNLSVVLCHVEITEFWEQTQDTSDLYEVKGSNEQISYLGQSRDKAMCFCCEVTSRF